MKTETAPVIRREDYRPTAYRIVSIHLEFDLHPTQTRVFSTLDIEAVKPDAGPLTLNGEKLKLLGVKIDGRPLSEDAYAVNDETLTIHAPPRRFRLETAVEISPATNTTLSGLYMSDGLFCTQCEAEGFRRITYFLDRPDVMATYSVRIVADRTLYPVILSNGNAVEQGLLPGGRHFAEWHDPFPKPSYLFALVAGDLARVGGEFVTQSGRRIALGIYVDRGNEDKCGYAMDALKRSMKWDEDTFGLEYDLDIFNIVAVSAFNSGAMENKGLNVFNDKYILANPETATDTDFELIEGVIAHEYFHNWTGNRITCRDWFQLCLKEGLTVFRDQQFSADMRSAAVKRIADVKSLRQRQFREDAGPLAHPVRPDSYMAIDNFYTATVYEKGAELCRMIHTIVGAAGFRKGMDHYFARHDGTAATVDDFAAAFEDANGADLTQFRTWWSQAGTPHLKASGRYDPGSNTYELTLAQSTEPTPGQAQKKPLHIPVRVALLDKLGADMKVELPGAAGSANVLHLTQASQTFVFKNVPEKPLPSILRGFSAPVDLSMELSSEDRAFLMAKDSDSFNRWDAGQKYATQVLVQMAESAKKGHTPEPDRHFVRAMGEVIKDGRKDPAFTALMLNLPGQGELVQAMEVADPDAIHSARMALINAIEAAHRDVFHDLYHALKSNEPYKPDAKQSGQRALRNACLRYLTASDTLPNRTLAFHQFRAADNMTDAIAALSALTDLDGAERNEALQSFYEKWKDTHLVVDKWMSVQAMTCRTDALAQVDALMRHPAFTLENPNRARSLIYAFAINNPLRFHAKDGSGYRFAADRIIDLDKINPQVAARLVGAFETWRKYDAGRQETITKELKRLAGQDKPSRNVSEMVGRTLG